MHKWLTSKLMKGREGERKEIEIGGWKEGGKELAWGPAEWPSG